MKNRLPYKKVDEADLSLRDLLALDRTILANERNLLSYIRSFFSFIVTGLALLKFFPEVKNISYILFISSLFVLIIGINRYIKLQKNLNNIILKKD